MTCSKCGDASTIKQGNQLLCDRHYRFGQMRASAKRNDKEVPSHEFLELTWPKDMKCVDCGVLMNWRAKNGQSTVASLQHYRSGEIGIVCRTCNTRHAFMDGDSYREMPKDMKLCPSCHEIKPLEMFTKDNSRSGIAKRKSHCKSCSKTKCQEWKEKNRDAYNQYQREWRSSKNGAS